MSIHGGLFHLLENMLYLWILGNNVGEHFRSFRGGLGSIDFCLEI
jgi:membrane associated rhomboid family serine protease